MHNTRNIYSSTQKTLPIINTRTKHFHEYPKSTDGSTMIKIYKSMVARRQISIVFNDRPLLGTKCNCWRESNDIKAVMEPAIVMMNTTTAAEAKQPK